MADGSNDQRPRMAGRSTDMNLSYWPLPGNSSELHKNKDSSQSTGLTAEPNNTDKEMEELGQRLDRAGLTMNKQQGPDYGTVRSKAHPQHSNQEQPRSVSSLDQSQAGAAQVSNSSNHLSFKWPLWPQLVELPEEKPDVSDGYLRRLVSLGPVARKAPDWMHPPAINVSPVPVTNVSDGSRHEPSPFDKAAWKAPNWMPPLASNVSPVTLAHLFTLSSSLEIMKFLALHHSFTEQFARVLKRATAGRDDKLARKQRKRESKHKEMLDNNNRITKSSSKSQRSGRSSHTVGHSTSEAAATARDQPRPHRRDKNNDDDNNKPSGTLMASQASPINVMKHIYQCQPQVGSQSQPQQKGEEKGEGQGEVKGKGEGEKEKKEDVEMDVDNDIDEDID